MDGRTELEIPRVCVSLGCFSSSLSLSLSLCFRWLSFPVRALTLLLFRKKFLTLAKAANWMALPGITLRILGVLPLQNPRTPSFFATSAITPGIVWPPLLAISTTLTRCSGAVRNLDAAPAAPPTKSCFKGSLGFVITLPEHRKRETRESGGQRGRKGGGVYKAALRCVGEAPPRTCRRWIPSSSTRRWT